jgi:ribosomal protein S18 acetylase RimI-like enzyme
MAKSIEKQVVFEIKKVVPEMAGLLGQFFEGNTGELHFHPHPLTIDEAARICAYQGPDIYTVALTQSEILAYGMLRGWEEGYAIPSLGILISSDARGTGLAQLIMQYLHYSARLRGASKIRLSVYPSNVKAVSLYRRIGYRFDSTGKNGQLIGIFEFPNTL